MGALRIDDDQRRARLAQRHAIAPAARVVSVAAAAEAVVAFHATEPASVHLAAHARADVTGAEVDVALYDERSVVKQLAMRRTVFAFPRRLLPSVRASAAARVATQQRAHLARELVRNAVVDDEAEGLAWVDATTAAVAAHLAAHGPTTTAELRRCLPELDERITLGAASARAETTFPLAPRVLTVLAAGGSVVRGANAGGWRSSRPCWTTAVDWLGPDEAVARTTEAEGYRELVRAWLARFGPGTEDDLVWWTGATKAAVRAALASLDSVAVELDAHSDQPPSASVGWVLAHDVDPVPQPEPWAALLPVLDPTTMGWKHRAFVLGEHREQLFDRNGNGGATAWWDGRMVGAWFQRPDGEVALALLEDVGAAAVEALEVEAARLSTFLAGEVVGSVYHSPLVRRHLAAP